MREQRPVGPRGADVSWREGPGPPVSQRPDPPGSQRPDPPRSQRAAFLRLAVAVAAGLAAAIVFHGLAVLVVVVALVLMVMIHELGHFVAAKASGMKVTEYFLGFGPRLWSVRRGETEYGVKAIPAGGYVRIVGMTALEEVAPEDEPRSYRQASFPRRLAVALAGSTMHFVMAFLLLWAMFAISGMPIGSRAQVATVAHFVGGRSPAASAGLRPGDVLVSVDGHRYGDANDLVRAIERHPNEEISLGIRRHGHAETIRLRPVDGRTVKVREPNGKLVPDDRPSGPAEGVIGVTLNPLTTITTVNPFVAVARAGRMLGTVTVETGQGIATVFSLHGLGSFAHDVATAGGHGGTASSSSRSSAGASSSGQVLSILGAIQIGAQAVGQDVWKLLYILVAINVFVGMINLFPMLPLDGGHVAIAVYERLRSRRRRRYHADVTKLMPVAYLFLAFMVLFGLGALYMNIVQPASLPGP